MFPNEPSYVKKRRLAAEALQAAESQISQGGEGLSESEVLGGPSAPGLPGLSSPGPGTVPSTGVTPSLAGPLTVRTGQVLSPSVVSSPIVVPTQGGPAGPLTVRTGQVLPSIVVSTPVVAPSQGDLVGPLTVSTDQVLPPSVPSQSDMVSPVTSSSASASSVVMGPDTSQTATARKLVDCDSSRAHLFSEAECIGKGNRLLSVSTSLVYLK